MIIKFITFCLIFIVLGAGYIFFMQPAMLSQITNDVGKFIPAVKEIKGISTSKPDKVPEKLKSEVDKEVKKVETKAKEIKIGDVMTILGNAQKYIQDFRNFQEYLKKEAGNLGK